MNYRQTVHIKVQALFSSGEKKNKNKITKIRKNKKILSSAVVTGTLKDKNNISSFLSANPAHNAR